MDTINQSPEIKSILRTLHKRCYFKEALCYFSLFRVAAQPSDSNLLATSRINCECVRNVKMQILKTHSSHAGMGHIPDGHAQDLVPGLCQCGASLEKDSQRR